MLGRAKRPRVKKSADDRRRDLLDAAVKVFTEKGIDRATVADITGAAGVAKGTFYLYFDSKERVVAAIRERFVAELTEHAAPFVEAVGKVDWWDLAEAVSTDMVDWTLSHRDLCTIIMQTTTAETSDIVAQADLGIIRLLADGIRLGMAAGEFEVGDPDLAAAFLYNGTIFTVIHQILYSPAVDRDVLVLAAMELHRKVLSPTSLPAATAGGSPKPTRAARSTRRSPGKLAHTPR